jgi:hypothetical protein
MEMFQSVVMWRNGRMGGGGEYIDIIVSVIDFKKNESPHASDYEKYNFLS